jgi:L-lactate dehydrogenase complex protein LldG
MEGTTQMSARDDILANVRRSLGASAQPGPRHAAAAARIAAAAPGVRPLRGHGEQAARVETFLAQAQAVQTSVERVASLDAAPGAVAAFLRAHDLPARLRMGADKRLADLPWSAAGLAISQGASVGDDLNAVSFAEAGVAETGTLVFFSGPHNPTTLNFLPDNHVAILRAADVLPDYESVWALARTRFGAGVLPRTVNFITGPSRSADIEQKLLLGAHGPRRLHVVLAEG